LSVSFVSGKKPGTPGFFVSSFEIGKVFFGQRAANLRPLDS
jgi:hypothetical protein